MIYHHATTKPPQGIQYKLDGKPQPIPKRYWLTPPDLYTELNKEFNFDFDPCPYPMRRDGLVIPWKKMNYVNPPFRKIDGSPTAFVHKAIEESKLGNSSFLTLPGPSYLNLLLEAGAIPRSLGRVKWLETISHKPSPSPSAITGFYLKGVIQ